MTSVSLLRLFWWSGLQLAAVNRGWRCRQVMLNRESGPVACAKSRGIMFVCPVYFVLEGSMIGISCQVLITHMYGWGMRSGGTGRGVVA